MNWWLKAAPYEKNRFFHVSLANDGEGWPTNSISDISAADIHQLDLPLVGDLPGKKIIEPAEVPAEEGQEDRQIGFPFMGKK